MRERQQNTTAHPITFLMVLSSDHTTGATGISPTVTLSKDGGSFAAPSGAVSEIGNGWYALAGNATDRNTLGAFLVHATGTGCDPMDVQYTITGYDPFDAVRLGLSSLPNVAAGAAGGLPTGDASGRVALSATQAGYAPSKAGDAMALTTGERTAVANAYLDLTDGIETGKTPRQVLRGVASVLLGNKTGEGTTAVAFAAAGNPGTPRVSGALDTSGNRTNTLTL
jgi:hypothetical protein